jgi:hypothetical protein
VRHFAPVCCSQSPSRICSGRLSRSRLRRVESPAKISEKSRSGWGFRTRLRQWADCGGERHNRHLSEGVRTMDRYGSVCMQPAGLTNRQQSALMSEDCLTLNVWAPKHAPRPNCAMEKVKKPAYLYLFSYVAARRRGQALGATHGSEIPFVFDEFPALVGAVVSPADR